MSIKGTIASLLVPLGLTTPTVVYFSRDADQTMSGASCNITQEQDDPHAHIKWPMFGEVADIQLTKSTEGLTGIADILGHHYKLAVTGHECLLTEKNAVARLGLSDITIHVPRSSQTEHTQLTPKT